MFNLIPPITVYELKQESFPAAPATNPLYSVGQGGLTVLFRPNNEQHHILNCNKKLRFSESLGDKLPSPSHPSETSADSLGSTIQEQMQAMQRKFKVLERGFEEETRAHRVFERRVEALERRLNEEMAELQRMMMMITPLHIRTLLNQARQQILTTLDFGGTWEDLRQQMETAGQSLVKHICANRHVKLNPEAVQFLCFNNHVCQSGNDAAHKATEGEIEKAVMTDSKKLGLNDRRLLEQLFQFTFGYSIGQGRSDTTSTTTII